MASPRSPSSVSPGSGSGPRSDMLAAFDMADALVLEGYLWKGKKRSPRVMQRRWFSNAGDIYTLSYFASDRSAHAHARKGFVDLREVDALRVSDFVDESWSFGSSSKTSCEFHIFCPDRVWVLSARGKESVAYWKAGFQRIMHFVSHPAPPPSDPPPQPNPLTTPTVVARSQLAQGLVVQSPSPTSSTEPASERSCDDSMLSISRGGAGAAAAAAAGDRASMSLYTSVSSYSSYSSDSPESLDEYSDSEQPAAPPQPAAATPSTSVVAAADAQPAAGAGVRPNKGQVLFVSGRASAVLQASPSSGSPQSPDVPRVFFDGTPPTPSSGSGSGPSPNAAGTSAGPGANAGTRFVAVPVHMVPVQTAGDRMLPIPRQSKLRMQRVSMMVALLDQGVMPLGSPQQRISPLLSPSPPSPIQQQQQRPSPPSPQQPPVPPEKPPQMAFTAIAPMQPLFKPAKANKLRKQQERVRLGVCRTLIADPTKEGKRSPRPQSSPRPMLPLLPELPTPPPTATAAAAPPPEPAPQAPTNPTPQAPQPPARSPDTEPSSRASRFGQRSFTVLALPPPPPMTQDNPALPARQTFISRARFPSFSSGEVPAAAKEAAERAAALTATLQQQQQQQPGYRRPLPTPPPRKQSAPTGVAPQLEAVSREAFPSPPVSARSTVAIPEEPAPTPTAPAPAPSASDPPLEMTAAEQADAIARAYASASPAAAIGVDPLSLEQQQEVCLQLVKQEIEYAISLQAAVNCYLVPLRKDKTMFSRIYKADLETLFSNIETIAELHRRIAAGFSEMLREARGTKGLTPALVVFRLFNKADPMRAAYREYVRNYPSAMATLVKCMKSKRVRNFFKQCKESAKGQELAALLAMPIERVSSYDLAFERIIELQGQNVGESELLMHEALHDLSEFVIDMHSRYQLERAEHSFRGLREPLAGKVFLRSGLLSVSRTMRVSRGEYYVWLFSDSFYLTKRFMGKYTVIMCLETALINEVATPAKKSRIFTVTFAEELEDMTFNCPTVEDCAAWVDVFTYARRRSHEKQLFGVDLTTLMQRRSERLGAIPAFLQETTKRLLPGGEGDLGSKLLSGEREREQSRPVDFAELKSLFNRGLPVPWALVPPHLVPEILRYWLRKLPSPIVPFHLYANFVEAKTREALREAVLELPLHHRFALQHLIETFIRMCSGAKVDNLVALLQRIAGTYGPCVLRTRDTMRNPRFTQFSASSNEVSAPAIIVKLAEHYAFIFRDVRLQRQQLEEELANREGEQQAKASQLRTTLRKQSRAISLMPVHVPPALAQQQQAATAGAQQEAAPTASSIHEGIALGDILHQGWLVKQGPNRSWDQRWFVLVRGGRLVYFKNDHDSKPQGCIDLRRRSVNTDGSKQFGICIAAASGGGGSRAIFIAAASESDRQEWLHVIQQCQQQQQQQPAPSPALAAAAAATLPPM